MRIPVKTHLPADEVPLEWAVTGDNVLYTALIPIRVDGSIEIGPIERQAEVTFDNLRRVLEAAGVSWWCATASSQARSVTPETSSMSTLRVG